MSSKASVAERGHCVQTERRSFTQTLRRLFSIMAVLALLFGNFQAASTASGENGRFASVNSSVTAQSADSLAGELASAMDVPAADLLNAELMGSDLRGAAVITTTLGNENAPRFPTEGSTFAVLATGIAADAGLPNNEENRQSELAGLNNSQGHDLVQLHLRLKVPDNINCASFDLAYYSEEFAEYVNSPYNDTFTAQIGNANLLISDKSEVSAPRNFAFDTKGNILAINSSFGVQGNTGTTYDGATPKLRARTAVVPSSIIDLYFSIQDLGDSIYDSAVFLDKFFWSEDPNCKEGATVDSDDDGLLDAWETQGLTVTVGGVTEFVNLPAMGADPHLKDIFVEIDYMKAETHTHQPMSQAITDVVGAFANAPVTNTKVITTNGITQTVILTPGIRLHVDYGPNAPLTYSGSVTATWGALSKSDAITHTTYLGYMDTRDNSEKVYSWFDFDEIKQTHFTPGRAAVFHYNMWIHSLPEERKGSSGQSRVAQEISDGASDFIVSLGGWNWANDVGTQRDQAGTFMHELGHNLGLDHGGADWQNYKPNYLSVMNYAFQFDGLIKNSRQGILDYSRFNLASLEEKKLQENTGVISKTATMTDTYGTMWFCPADQQGKSASKLANDVTLSVDWDCDTVITTTTTITVNINAGKSDEPDTELTDLQSFSDWDRLVYTGGALGQPGASVVLPDATVADEITKEEADRIPALYPEIVAAAPEKLETWTLQSTLAGHTAPVWGFAWSPDGSQFASSAADATVRVWDAVTGAERVTLTGHTLEVHSVAWSPDGRLIASGSADRTIRIWNAATGEVVAAPESQAGTVRSVAWSPDGSRLASGAQDGTVQIWNAATWTVENTLAGHTSAVNSVAWSPDGSELASGADDAAVRVWDAATGAERMTYAGHTAPVASVAWSPDGARLASGAADGTVRIWDMAFDAFLATLAGHTAGVQSVAWSPDGAQMASGSVDQTTQIWDVASGGIVATLTGFPSQVNSIAWSPDGARLAVGVEDSTVQLWNRAAFHVRTQWDVRSEIVGLGVGVLSTAWSPVDSRVAYGTDDGALRIWDTATGEAVTIFNAHADGIRVVAWSPDGSKVASAADDRSVRMWDATTGENLAALEGHTAGATSVAWSPDGNRLASGAGTGDSTVRIWDVAAGETVNTLQGHTEEVSGVAWSPDGSRIATASMDKTVRLWEAKSGEPILVLEGHDAGVASVAWSPDGSLLASGSADTTVRVWNAAAGAGASHSTLAGHTAAVSKVAWSADGSQLASASGDGTIHIWNAATEESSATLAAHNPAAQDVAWSSDSRLLVSGGMDGSVRVWNAVAEQISLLPTSSASSSPTATPAPVDQSQNNTYVVENRWGNADAPWHAEGDWIIGGRADQRVVALNASSSDGGQTLSGTMSYADGSLFGFRATRTAQNTYTVENQFGGDEESWSPGGTWVLGGRDNQNVVALAISSEDGGSTLNGTMTYAGEGPISFRATLVSAPASE